MWLATMISGPDLGTFSRPSTWMRVTHCETTREGGRAALKRPTGRVQPRAPARTTFCDPLNGLLERVVSVSMTVAPSGMRSGAASRVLSIASRRRSSFRCAAARRVPSSPRCRRPAARALLDRHVRYTFRSASGKHDRADVAAGHDDPPPVPARAGRAHSPPNRGVARDPADEFVDRLRVQVGRHIRAVDEQSDVAAFVVGAQVEMRTRASDAVGSSSGSTPLRRPARSGRDRARRCRRSGSLAALAASAPTVDLPLAPGPSMLTTRRRGSLTSRPRGEPATRAGGARAGSARVRRPGACAQVAACRSAHEPARSTRAPTSPNIRRSWRFQPWCSTARYQVSRSDPGPSNSDTMPRLRRWSPDAGRRSWPSPPPVPPRP